MHNNRVSAFLYATSKGNWVSVLKLSLCSNEEVFLHCILGLELERLCKICH